MSRGDFGAPSYGSTTSASYHRTPRAREKDKFNSLCDDVSGKIFLINKNVSKLESLSKAIDNGFEELQNEKKIHSCSQETNKLANETKDIFKDISEYTRVGRYSGDDPRLSQYNLLQNKLRKEFENSLSRYHAIQNVLSLKLKAHIQQERLDHQDSSHTEEQLISIDDDKQNLLSQQQQKQQQQMLLEEELEQTKQREIRIKQIEKDMLDVNEIFRDMASLVHEQGEAIDSIESHIEHAAINVEEGNKQLIRAKAYQKSARKRFCIILLVALIVAIILGVIIYYSAK